MRFEETVDIDTSQQRAWDVLSDIQGWPGRVETVEGVDVLTSLPLAKGSRVRLRQTNLPEGTWEITEWDPPSFFEMRQESGGVTSLAGHRVETVEAGRARLTLTVDMQGWLVPVVGRLAKTMTMRYLASEAAAIKRAAESEA